LVFIRKNLKLDEVPDGPQLVFIRKNLKLDEVPDGWGNN